MTADASGLTSATTATVTIATTLQGALFQAPFNDARRGSTNTNDLRGKILRISVNGDGTYSVPSGNMFPSPRTSTTRPVPRSTRWASGTRSGSRSTRTASPMWPTTRPTRPRPRATVRPAGTGRIEIVRKPANYGWPHVLQDRPADVQVGLQHPDDARRDVRVRQPGPRPREHLAVEHRPGAHTADHQPGRLVLVPRRPWGTPCFASYNTPTRQGTCPRIFPELGQGGVGPHVTAKYDYDADNPSATKFPPYYDNALFFGEWTRDYLREIRSTRQNRVFKINNVLNCGGVGVRAAVRVRQPDGRAVRLRRQLLPADVRRWVLHPEPGCRHVPVVVRQGAEGAERGAQNTDRTDGPTPLRVAVLERGLGDPDPGDAITFAWDFDGNGTTDSTDPNASRTYTDGRRLRREADGDGLQRPVGREDHHDHGGQHQRRP